MSAAVEIISELARRGVTLWAEGDSLKLKLRFRPGRRSPGSPPRPQAGNPGGALPASRDLRRKLL